MLTGLRTAVAAGCMLMSLIVDAGAQAPASRLFVEGTRFVSDAPDGRRLTSTNLIGAEFSLGNGMILRIDSVERDADDESSDPADAVWLHGLSVRSADGVWRNLCQPDPAGRRLGFPIAGRFSRTGSLTDEAGEFGLVCTAGGQGKCVRFGYKPWLKAPDGRPLRDLYNACVHMLRADYCGDGQPATRDGTLIRFHDRYAIRPRSPSSTIPAADEPRFEAAWGPDGAVCVRRTRLPELLDLPALLARCPRLAARVGEACDEHAPDAVLFNLSR